MDVESLLWPAALGDALDASNAAAQVAVLVVAGIAARSVVGREAVRAALRSLRIGLRVHR